MVDEYFTFEKLDAKNAYSLYDLDLEDYVEIWKVINKSSLAAVGHPSNQCFVSLAISSDDLDLCQVQIFQIEERNE
jgi:hypothetical protein